MSLATACGVGGTSGDSTPLGSANTPPQLLACRSRVDDPLRFAEIALRDHRNLGTGRVSDRSGQERSVRLHPDGNRVVFTRERTVGDLSSRELFVSSLDGSIAELRLTQNTVRDDAPCWSPDGTRVLFTSDRNGISGLWLIDADGQNAAPFLVPPAGFGDGDADWHGGSQRVVFSRRAGDGHHSLWLANDNGQGAVPMTDGGPNTGDGSGDREPSFSLAGDRVVCVRRIDQERASLVVANPLTFEASPVYSPDGNLGTPRFAPTMDRLFFGLAEPAAGRATLRLATIPLGGGTPSLLWPDQRWELVGLDLLPALPAAVAGGSPTLLDVEKAEVQLAAGSGAFGSRSQLANLDGEEYRVSTTSFDLREIAGINVRHDLPVVDAEHVLELRVRAVARASRVGGDAKLRMSIYNPVDTRFDTVVEIAPGSTGVHEMTFRTSSLRHVTREKQLRVTVIADLPPGERAELLIDLLQVELIALPGSR